MKGVYTVEAKITGWTSIKAALLIDAPAGKVVELLSADMTQVGANVVNQQLEMVLARVATRGSPVGTSATPNPEEPGDAAAGSVVTVALGTDVTAYGVNLDRKGFSSLAGYHYDPLPEERGYIAPSASAALHLVVAPTSADFTIQLKFREIG